MSIHISVVGEDLPELTRTRFPGGETGVRIGGSLPWYKGDKSVDVIVELRFEDNGDLFDLALLMDAARRKFGSRARTYTLYMNYLPYARQDRVCNEGESLSVKVVADFINGLKFDTVVCKDIHSEVGAALLDNLSHHTLPTVARGLLFKCPPENTVLVSPDAGANKKVLGFAKDVGYTQVVRADKTRELATGKITGTVVYSENVGDKDFLIVDDICDGGRTFIELAKELRKLTTGKVLLYVTHGIFSQGTKVFDGLIDHVYTSNPVGITGIQASNQPNVTII